MEDAETVGLSVHFQDPNFLRQLQREATQGDGMFEDASVRARRLIVDMAAHISKLNRTAFDRSPSSATRVSRTASQSAFVPQSSLTHSVVHAPSSARSPTGSSYRVGSSAKKKTRAAAEGSMAWLRLHRSQKVERVREIVRALESCSHILLTDLQREWCLPPGDIDERDRPVTDWNLDRQREELVQTRNSVVDALSHLEAFIAESFTQAEKRLIGGNTHRLQSAKARANQFQYHRSDDMPFPSYLDPETYSVKHSPPPATFYDPTKPKGANRVPVPTSSLSGRHSPNDASAAQQRSRPTFVEEQPPAAATSSAEPARSLPPVAARTGSQESLDFDGGESPDDTSAIVGAPVDTAGHTPPPQGPSGTDRGASFPAARPLDFGSPAVGGADPPPAMADSAAASVENLVVAVEPQATTSAPVPPPPSSNAGVARKIVVQPTAQKGSPAQSGGATPQYASSRPAVRRAEPVVVQPEPNGPGQPPTTQPSSTVVPVVTSQQEQAPSSNQGLAPRVVVQPGSAARRSPSVPPSSVAAPAHVGRPAELQSSPPPQTASPAQLLLRNLARHSDSDSEEDRAGA